MDIIHSHYLFESRYKIVIPFRQDWEEKRDSLPGNGTNWYTVRSMLGDAKGAGYYSRKDGKGTFISLGKHTANGDICHSKMYLKDFKRRSR